MPVCLGVILFPLYLCKMISILYCFIVCLFVCLFVCCFFFFCFVLFCFVFFFFFLGGGVYIINFIRSLYFVLL